MRMQLFTDASGTMGWGAYWCGRWLQRQWSELQLHMDISWKELIDIVMAVHAWGSLWQRQKILSHCDNQAVISIWESGSTCAKETMALVHLLQLLFCSKDRFKELTPQANPAPDNIPAWLSQSFIDASCNAAILE